MESHLLQMRGLKQAYSEGKSLDTVSHLLQMRGLKPVSKIAKNNIWVASFTDAWIETPLYRCPLWLLWSHLLQMRGLKPVRSNSLIAFRRRIFYRCVD